MVSPTSYMFSLPSAEHVGSWVFVLWYPSSLWDGEDNRKGGVHQRQLDGLR